MRARWARARDLLRQSPRLAAILVVLRRTRDPVRVALGKEYIAREVLREPVVFTDRFDCRFLLYPSDDLYDRYVNEGYNERAEQDFCARWIQPGMNVVDAGANYGIYTVLFSTRVGDGRVHAFEPEAWNFARLQGNLLLNECGNVRAERKALAAVSGEVVLNVYPREQFGWHTLGSAQMEVDGEPYPPERHDRVEAVTLDDYWDAAGDGNIDFLKIDVEGAELQVLEGARGLLDSHKIRAIMFEVSPLMIEGMGTSADDVFRFLRERGYSLHAFGRGGALAAVGEVPEPRYENFLALPPDATLPADAQPR